MARRVSQAEIEQSRATAIIDEHVLGLQVAMQKRLCMEEVEGLCDSRCPRETLVDRRRCCSSVGALARDPFEYDERPASVIISNEVERARYARMREGSDARELVGESIGFGGVSADLEHHGRRGLLIERDVDVPAFTRTDQFEQAITSSGELLSHTCAVYQGR